MVMVSLYFFSFAQAAAAAQAGASVIQIFVGRIRVIFHVPLILNDLVLLSFKSLMFIYIIQDWARNHSGDPEVEVALKRGEDPGIALVSLAVLIIL